MADRSLDVSKVDVIFAEDEPVFQELALPVLEKAGFRAERINMSSEGGAALNDFIRLQEEGESDLPLIVFLDVRMPGMDGKAAGIKMLEMIDEKACKRQAFLASCSANVTQACVNDVHPEQPFQVTLTKPLTIKEVLMCVDVFKDLWRGASFRDPFTMDVAKLPAEAPAADAPCESSLKASAESASTERRAELSASSGSFGSMDIIVADSEPICRMALMGQLETVGSGSIDEDSIIEMDDVEETKEALKEQQEADKAARPLVLFLGVSRWYNSIVEMKLERKPLIVFTLVDSEGIAHLDLQSSHFHIVLPSSQTTEDLTKVLDECSKAFAEGKGK